MYDAYYNVATVVGTWVECSKWTVVAREVCCWCA